MIVIACLQNLQLSRDVNFLKTKYMKLSIAYLEFLKHLEDICRRIFKMPVHFYKLIHLCKKIQIYIPTKYETCFEYFIRNVNNATLCIKD